MSNHYHLVIRQHIENGIVRFMQKIGTGYTMYFNLKYDRVGGLFQGRFKATLVDRNEYLMYLLYYLHANPLGLKEKRWKDRELKNASKLLQWLNSYRWSSHLDYCGRENFSTLLEQSFIVKLLEPPPIATVGNLIRGLKSTIFLKSTTCFSRTKGA